MEINYHKAGLSQKNYSDSFTVKENRPWSIIWLRSILIGKKVEVFLQSLINQHGFHRTDDKDLK